MGGEISGFLTGFFNQQSDEMEVQRQEARDYFNKQVDMARTQGVANRNRVAAAVDESTTAARKLEALGVPRDIILAQANMDPTSLGNLYDQVTKIQLETGTKLDEKAYRDLFSMSGNFSAPDEDFTTFFSRMYEPIKSSATEDPQGFKSDPGGSIWARAFGFGGPSQMDKARAKLATTEVAPGLTAEQAIQYGDTVVPNRPNGASTVTLNPDALQSIMPRDPITPTEAKQIEEVFKTTQTAILREIKVGAAATEEEKTAAAEAALEKLSQSFEPKFINYLRVQLGLPEEMPVEATGEATEAPTDSAGTETTPPPTPPLEATTGTPEEVAPLSEEELNRYGALDTSIITDNDDGTSTVTKNDGTSAVVPNKVLRDYINTKNPKLPPLRLE